MLLVLERVLDRQRAAPGLPEQVEVGAIEAERLAHLLHLVDEAWDLPQIRVVGLIAVGGAELIVVVVLDPGGREIGVAGFEVLMRRAGSPVQHEDLHRRVVADPFRPHPELALRRDDRDELHPAGKDVVPPGVIEVGLRCLHLDPFP